MYVMRPVLANKARARNPLLRHICATILLAAAMSQPALVGRNALAQSASEPEEVAVPRSEWLANVEESRRRIEQMRREGRSFVPPPPTQEEIAKETFQRAVEDESLRSGDIVATDRGLLVFKGRSSGQRTLNDFVPLNPATAKP